MFEFQPLKTLQKGVDTNIYYAALVNGVEVGYILIQNYNFKVGNVELAYKIYEPFRGHHIGTNMVKEFMDFAKKVFYITYFDAVVRDSNYASQHILQNNGFEMKKNLTPKSIMGEVVPEKLYFFYDVEQKRKENPSQEDVNKVLKEIE